MLTAIKFINGIMSLVNMIMGMVRDEKLRDAGRNQVAASNAARLEKARRKAHAKVQTFDDAITVARSRVPDSTSSD